ncbi:Hypothetical predicted protein [Mytilus galloprovincialis]|uniref:Mitochondria-eating protein C-terminal domain-containing protein n=1 Tax=Mytilus galloprovincialis TaxID=29158 RepID=A0A8B6C3Q1_MYTGA|nr:Hypothetical predicted protein [Mytilus galloprovincialis]
MCNKHADWFIYKMTDFDDSHIYETVSHKKMTKKEKKEKKKQDESLIRKLRQQCDELEVQLSLKKDILEKTDKKNSKLFDENKKLKYDINILELDKDEVIARIKELGGQQNTDKRHISLNDRSELIGQKWESLYQHEWTAAYEELCSKDKEGKCHKGPERHLMEVIEWCYDKCSELARDQTEKIQPLLSDITHHLYLQPSSNNTTETNECVSSTLENLARHIRRCQYDTDIVENIKQKCTDEYKLLHKEVLKTELKFVTNCCELCWLMRLSDPPLVIEYKNLEGTSFDASKFTKYNFVGNKVEVIVWPALLVHEKGTYVRKGIARTYNEVEDSIYDFPPKIPAALLNGKTQIFKNSDHTEVPLTDVNKIHSTKPLPTPKINDYMTMKNTEWLSSSDPFPREEASTPSWVHFNERKNPFDTHDRPNDRCPEEPKQDLFSNLSRSAEYNGSVDDHLNLRTKSPNKKHKLKPPKDGHFVSYLNTSSTL